jgi:alkaline phosphatase
MAYVDGFVIPIPKKNLRKYRVIARKAGKVWMEYGALEYRECIGDDLKVKGITSFERLTRVKKGETVLFSWILYRTKTHRNIVNAKVMMDPAKSPIDTRRMAYGGYRSIVEL